MVSFVPGKRMFGLTAATSLLLLATKYFGSSGGGALVGANDGAAVPEPLGISPVDGSWEVGLFASSLPFAETTAMATAVPTAIVASAPPPMNSSLRRLLR